jgi:hypothetical protein
MNDPIIRENFHRKILRKHHVDESTLVIDELGLNHGENRADITVINGLMIGYEIKSDNDSLYRLEEQIKSYNAIFDKAYIIIGPRHCKNIHKYLPRWWGIIIANKGKNSTIKFKVIRKSYRNNNIHPISIARLLWRDEVKELLKEKHISNKILRQPRAFLYETLVDSVNIDELRKSVRQTLKMRRNWRCHT